jgi:hypothetical protein
VSDHDSHSGSIPGLGLSSWSSLSLVPIGLKECDLALTVIQYASLIGTDLTAAFILPAPADRLTQEVVCGIRKRRRICSILAHHTLFTFCPVESVEPVGHGGFAIHNPIWQSQAKDLAGGNPMKGCALDRNAVPFERRFHKNGDDRK